MAQLLESRCASEDFLGSEHVLRVACIGDSMMYGSGVPAREILPAQLAKFMNAAFPDRFVWVDAFGEGSGQIWNAWTRFKARAEFMRFDAVVFSVCQNDITLLDTNEIKYPNVDYVRLWIEDSYITKAAADLFCDVNYSCRKFGIIPLVIFYTLVEGDRPIIARVSQICADASVAFVDLLSFFNTRTAINPTSYSATEFDGHPSSLGHELAARGIVEIFRKSPELHSGKVEVEPERVLPAALTDLLAQGVAADTALAWAADALAAKHGAARRSHRRDERSVVTRFDALTVKVRTLAERWRILRRIESRMQVADEPLSALLPKLEQLYALVRNLDELIYLLVNTADRDRLAIIGRQYLSGWYGEAGRLDFFNGDVASEIAEARGSLQALSVAFLLEHLATEREAGPWQALSAIGRLTLGSLTPELARLGQFAARIHSQLDVLSTGWSALQFNHSNDYDVMRLWAVVFHIARAALRYLRDCDALFSRGPALAAPIFGPWTSVDVVIEGQPDPAVTGVHFLLMVNAWYKVPRRMPAREAHWGGAAKDRYAYHFEIPALLFGDIRVGVADNEPVRERFLRGTTRIAEIRISSGAPDGATPPQLAMEWRNPGKNLPYVDFPGVALP